MPERSLTDINGVLCIRERYLPSSLKPTYQICDYPTEIKTKDFIYNYGEISEYEVTKAGDNYMIRHKSYLRGPINLCLKDGIRTVCIHQEEIPILPPKVKKGTEVRWSGFDLCWKKRSPKSDWIKV